MIHPLFRAAAMASLGALAGAVSVVTAYGIHPAVTLEMDRDLPRRTVAGLYPSERDGDRTFAWTSRQADFRFPGLARDVEWVCSLAFRGGRGDSLVQPVVDVAVDGTTLIRQTATNEFRLLEVTLPARPLKSGLTLTVTSSSTIIPGPSDRRELGIQVDRLSCRPAGAGVTLPPRALLSNAVIAAAVLGAALGLCLPMGSAAVGVALIAVAQALPLVAGIAPYSAFPNVAVRLATWTAIVTLVGVQVPALVKRLPLSYPARLVVIFSAAALYLKLLGLLHPSKLLVDAVYHAHRFQTVLAGQYYFTQTMPDGVRFPYAIALYLFAVPWSALTRDHVMLLRIVVAASEVVAGALLYLAVVKVWNDRFVAVVAVILFNLVPLPYGLVGSANLTNAFGQSVALVTIATATIWSLRVRNVGVLAALFVLASLALLSHISTAALLAVTMVSMAVLYRWLGDPPLHRPAWTILAVAIAAAAFSWVTYYGHFTEVYATLERVRSTARTAVAVPQEAPGGTAETPAPPQARRPGTPLLSRILGALSLTGTSIGWPIVILAIAGAWHLWSSKTRDRLVLVLLAWGTTYVTCFSLGILPRVESSFERYAVEFVGRVVFATYPAAVILAARGTAWGWRAGLPPRAAASALLIWAIFNAAQQWRGWF